MVGEKQRQGEAGAPVKSRERRAYVTDNASEFREWYMYAADGMAESGMRRVYMADGSAEARQRRKSAERGLMSVSGQGRTGAERDFAAGDSRKQTGGAASGQAAERQAAGLRVGRKRRRVAVLCLAAMLFGGCARGTETGDGEESKEPIVNFRAITLGNMPEGGMDEIYRQLDALTIPELNCTLRFEFIPWGNERRQLNIVTASGEYDFIPGGVFSDYRTLVYKNAFLDMNQYLDAVPALAEHYAYFDENALKKCEINGGLYGLPQFGQGGIASVGEGFFYREDLRREWGLEEVYDLESMEAYLYRAKQDERYRDTPLVTDNRVWSSLWLLLTKGKYQEVNSSLRPLLW